LRVPNGIGSILTIEPEGAAIAAAKIFALENKELADRITGYQLAYKKEFEKNDELVRNRK
jgi:phosphoribosylcarboxyaminoimidazole (NCAIR) mutase